MEPEGSLRTHKRPPPVRILGQPNPVPIPTPHLLEIHPNIIHPSTPRSPQWSLSLRFRHQEPIRPPLLTHTHRTNLFLIDVIMDSFQPLLWEVATFPSLPGTDKRS